MSQQARCCRKPLPDWLRRRPGSAVETREIKQLLRQSKLSTVCEEARCPNIVECFGRGTLTFLILGDRCTRSCRFCSVEHGCAGAPAPEPWEEADRVADTAEKLGLRHVVVTSVTRDDLPDGGAQVYAQTVAALRSRIPAAAVELLIPDFAGCEQALHVVVDAAPDILGHNLETVPRLYPKLRPQAAYRRSLNLLQRAKEMNPSLTTKTGIMLGLGETAAEVRLLMREARQHGVDVFTAGQYLQPDRRCAPVEDYLAPEIFDRYRVWALEIGFRSAAIGPLVRSSYRADEYAGAEREAACRAKG